MLRIVFSFFLCLLATYCFGQVSGLNEIYDSPEQVKVLDLHREKLTHFPIEIFQCSNLEVLILSKNKLETLPDSGWENLPNLRFIDVSRNKIGSLPAAWATLPLDTLIANRNYISFIPDSYVNLDSLIFLDIWSNELDELPEGMNEMPNLKQIDMRGISMNRIYQAEFIAKFPKIEILVSPGCDCPR